MMWLKTRLKPRCFSRLFKGEIKTPALRGHIVGPIPALKPHYVPRIPRAQEAGHTNDWCFSQKIF